MRLQSVLFALFASNIGLAQPVGMFELYESNRAQGVSNYITEDFLLLSYAMTLDRSLAEVEARQCYPELIQLTDALLAHLRRRPEANAATPPAIAFLSVLKHLLDGSTPAESDAISAELRRIRAAAGLERSVILRQKIDYTQFRVRGHYSNSPDLGRYFLAVRFAGIGLFAVRESAATGITAEDADALTAQAVRLTRALSDDQAAGRLYTSFLRRWDWVAGPSDDLTADDLLQIASAAPGASATELRRRLLDCARKQGRQPVILAAPVDVARLEPGVTARDALTGWRFLPQRFSPDAAAFQELVYDRVKTYLGKGKPFTLATIGGQQVKGFPTALEIAELLGSAEAARRLDRAGERHYTGYAKARTQAAAWMAKSAGLSSEHLQILRRWLAPACDSVGAGRRLNSVLSFWTWMRYQNSLYAKQSYTAVSKSVALGADRQGAWIEPALELYLLLRRQTDRLRENLGQDSFHKLSRVMDRAIDITIAELAGTPPGGEDAAFLNNLDRELLDLTGRPDAPIVVDVHTEPNSGLVVEEAIAFPHVVQHEIGKGRMARGALFSHREFKQPMAERLNDESWLEKLRSEEKKR